MPFDSGIAFLLAHRGRRVVMLASGDPFHFGAGASVARHLAPDEWHAIPAPSTFSLAAARLGWSVQNSLCLGLHAAPFTRLRPHLAPGCRMLILVRDGDAVGALAHYLSTQGFGGSCLHVMEALGGPQERVRTTDADHCDFADIRHPVIVAATIEGTGRVVPRASGIPDDWFAHDGQLTKRPARALTLSALAPRPRDRLWDIGAGSGSIAIEWLLAHPTTEATAFEADSGRAARARSNALALGVDRLTVVEGHAPDALAGHPLPDAVFIGGGLSPALLDHIWSALRPGTRIVANAVTLESEALLAQWHDERGGHLLRIELAEAAPLGTRRGWRSAYPLVQWTVTR